MNHLEKKLERIIESMKLENGNSQTICAFLEQYNELKKRYEQHRFEYEKMTKDTEAVKKKCNDLIEDRNSLALEKDALKHQLVVANYEKDQLKKQHEDTIREMNQVMDKQCIDIRVSTDQRNAAEMELSMLLGEKDIVLKENQKLSDDLMLVVKKSNELELRHKEDKQSLLFDMERLKRELEASVKYRDEVLKECESLREKIESLSSSSKGDSSEHMKSRSEFKSTSNESWSKELTCTKEFSMEQNARNIEALQRENELLRKQLEKMHNEMVKATQDTDLAKSRRDWAITEREKIVQERDSVKILCDELRKERDTAISELLAAIRDSENIKKQKDEAYKEIEQLKEHLESQLAGNNSAVVATATANAAVAGPPNTTPPCGTLGRNTRWSCASYDMDASAFRKTDTETIDIDISGLPTDGVLGLVLDGGRDDTQLTTDNTGVYVVSIVKDSVCDGKLRPNDCILKVNNLDCANVSRRIVLETIRSSAPRCKVVVKRQLMNATHLYTTCLNLKCGRSHGLSFESGILISKIDAGSLAARDNNLAVGDRIISINKRSMEGVKSQNDALMQLDDNRNDTAVIVALKQIGQMNANKLMYNKMVNICTQTDDSSVMRFFADEKRHSIPSSALIGNGSSSNGGGGGGGGSGGGGVIGGVNSESNIVCSSAKPLSSSSGVQQAVSTGSAPTNTPAAKSTSKLTEIFKIIRGKTPKTNTENVDADNSQAQNENEAISLLDFVLNSENSSSSKGSNIKRSKRKKESKESNNSKSMGTWPRANIIAHENLSGTIVQKPKRERPTLSVFNAANDVGPAAPEPLKPQKRDSAIYFEPQQQQQQRGGTLPSKAPNQGFIPLQIPSRNAPPLQPFMQPPYLMNRHSVYSTMESSDPISITKSSVPSPSHPLSGAGSGGMVNTMSRIPRHHMNDHDRYQHNQVIAMNRMSLNFTPSDQSLMYNNMLAAHQEQLKAKAPPVGGTISSHHNHQQFLDLHSRQQQYPHLPPKLVQPLDIGASLPMKPPSREALNVAGMRKLFPDMTKYPSDNEYLAPSLDGIPPGGPGTRGNTCTLPAYGRNHGGNIYGVTAPGAVPSRGVPLPKSLPLSHGSPLTSPITTTQSTDSTSGMFPGISIPDKSAFEGYVPLPTYHHSHGNSIDYPYQHRNRYQASREEMPSHFTATGYEGGTFPRKKENQRFRIPSNHSVTSRGSGVKNSTGSIEQHHGSERGSPMPIVQVEVLCHGSNLNKQNTEYCLGQKPSPGDLRRVTIDKSVEPLGITIRCKNNDGGIFVSTVTENSIASQVGLQTGDQLLEVCGLNMRAANYELAASVLRQCGNTMNMLVQYNPDSE